MTAEEVSKIIVAAERRYPVDQWRVDGVNVWPFIRLDNYSRLSYKALRSNPLNTKSANYIQKLIKGKWDGLQARISDRKRNADISGGADAVFLADGVSFSKLEGSWFNKLHDPIVMRLKAMDLRSIRIDLSHSYLTPRYYPSIFLQRSIDNIIIRSYLTGAGGQEAVQLPMYEEFREDHEVSAGFANVPSVAALIKRIQKVSRIKHYFSRLLKKISPRIGFVDTYYGDTQLAFILACREAGIKTVDVQHGVQGPFHMAYGNWTRIPDNGYDCMPDFFWVWSEYEKNTIDAWSTGKAVIGGNLFAEIWKDNDSELVSYYDKAVDQLIAGTAMPSILLTLSPFTENLMGDTWQVVEATQNKYNWFIRLHPSMMQDSEQIKAALKAKRILRYNLDEASSLPLHSLLRKVDCHITSQSSCVIEAADFGISSVITSEYGGELFCHHISDGIAFLCTSHQEIIEKIDLAIRNRTQVLASVQGNNALSGLLKKCSIC